jgi:hypothetical protein
MMPIIPGTQELDIGGSRFQASLDKKLVRLYLKNNPGTEGHAIIPVIQEAEIGRSQSEAKA